MTRPADHPEACPLCDREIPHRCGELVVPRERTRPLNRRELDALVERSRNA